MIGQMVDKWSVKRQLSEWHGIEVLTLSSGVIYGGFLWGGCWVLLHIGFT